MNLERMREGAQGGRCRLTQVDEAFVTGYDDYEIWRSHRNSKS